MDQAQPVFYYDLGSPQCYVLAETIMATLPVVPEWEPVLASRIAPVDPEERERTQVRAQIEQLAAARDLQPFRWPPNWPPDSTSAMLAATYAKRIGRAVAFSLAAFRQAFAGGRDLADEDTILIAGAATEMHPVALRKGIALASTTSALDAAIQRALSAGVRELPAIELQGQIFAGPDAAVHAAHAAHAAAALYRAR